MQKGVQDVKPSIVVCIDEINTAVREDGFYLLHEGDTTILRIAAVAVIDKDALDTSVIKRTLNTNKFERGALGNPKMCHHAFVKAHNFSAKQVPSIVVELHFNQNTGNMRAAIFLDEVKAFKHFNYSEAQTFLRRGNGTLSEINRFVHTLMHHGYVQNFNAKTQHTALAQEHNLVRTITWLFNRVCRTVAQKERIPILCREDVRSLRIAQHREDYAIFNCPFRNPLAAINNTNLTYFLDHGSICFSESDLRRMVRENKKPA